MCVNSNVRCERHSSRVFEKVHQQVNGCEISKLFPSRCNRHAYVGGTASVSGNMAMLLRWFLRRKWQRSIARKQSAYHWIIIENTKNTQSRALCPYPRTAHQKKIVFRMARRAAHDETHFKHFAEKVNMPTGIKKFHLWYPKHRSEIMRASSIFQQVYILWNPCFTTSVVLIDEILVIYPI